MTSQQPDVTSSGRARRRSGEVQPAPPSLAVACSIRWLAGAFQCGCGRCSNWLVRLKRPHVTMTMAMQGLAAAQQCRVCMSTSTLDVPYTVPNKCRQTTGLCHIHRCSKRRIRARKASVSPAILQTGTFATSSRSKCCWCSPCCRRISLRCWQFPVHPAVC